jgi:hypothetical protein
VAIFYRDGRFCGNEAQCLADWAAVIKAKFLLIECCKSGCPRLYNIFSMSPYPIQAPDRGIALKLSNREAILVATKVAPRIGVPKPMRVNIRPEGHQVSIDDVLETYLKPTLLHYDSLNPPKLPAEMRRQHWL